MDNFAQPQTYGPNAAHRIDQVSANAMAALAFDLHWQSAHAKHTDCLVAEKLDLCRDLLPAALEPEIIDKPVGHTFACNLAPGELTQPHVETNCMQLPQSAFNPTWRRLGRTLPRAGRFYPRGWIAGVKNIYPEDRTPFRVAANGPQLLIDLNHPLAGLPTVLEVSILDAWCAGDEHGGRCNDIAEIITIDGPGMQVRWRQQPTDFFSDLPFERALPNPDVSF